VVYQLSRDLRIDALDVVDRLEAVVYNQGHSKSGQSTLSYADGGINVLPVKISGEGVSWKAVGQRVQDLLDKIVQMRLLPGADQKVRKEQRQAAGARVRAKVACAHDARLVAILRVNFGPDKWEEATLWEFYSSCQSFYGACVCVCVFRAVRLCTEKG